MKRSIRTTRDTYAMADKHDKDPKRDQWADREADKDRDEDDEHKPPPSGSLGPGGSALDHLKDEAMETDPPDARG